MYCPHPPGFGLTENYEDAYPVGLTGHVDFLHEFTTALCVDRFHLSGNSMGCMNTVAYTTAHPERVTSDALIAGGIGDIIPMEKMMATDTRKPEERPNIMQFDGTPESMRKMMAAIILDPAKITDDLVEMRTRAALKHREYYAKHMGAAMSGGQDPNAAARLSTKGRFDKMTIPGIYMYGKKDVLMSHDVFGYPQEDALPDVQFFYPEDTGHHGRPISPNCSTRCSSSSSATAK